jgi:hypothetical protein
MLKVGKILEASAVEKTEKLVVPKMMSEDDTDSSRHSKTLLASGDRGKICRIDEQSGKAHVSRARACSCDGHPGGK